jgi:hypothetical protein
MISKTNRFMHVFFFIDIFEQNYKKKTIFVYILLICFFFLCCISSFVYVHVCCYLKGDIKTWCMKIEKKESFLLEKTSQNLGNESQILYFRWLLARNEQLSHQKLLVDGIFWFDQLIDQMVDVIMFVQIQHVKRVYLEKQICIVKRKLIEFFFIKFIIILWYSHAQEQGTEGEGPADISAQSDQSKLK